MDLQHDRFPRSNTYDLEWIIKNQMGPNPLWLTESLIEHMTIEPGMKVLDLGCGRALSSVFLAREHGARVWATDLWISASENQKTVTEAGFGDLITPIHAEAHTLPFAAEFFDVIISIDAYQYFGTSDLYLGYIVEFLKPGGQIGCAMPSTMKEIGADIPEKLQPFWDWEFCAFHTPDWWRAHWAKTGKVEAETAAAVEDGWKDWLRFNDAVAPTAQGWWVDDLANTHKMLEADEGEYFGFTEIVATKLAVS